MNNIQRRIKILIVLSLLSLTMIACDEDTTNIHKEETSTETLQTTEDSSEIETSTNLKAEQELNTEEKSSSKVQEEMLVHYIDAGQADATLFEYTDENDTYTILYDTGNWNKSDVLNYLTRNDIELIDLVIISHPHADHIGQLARIIETFQVGEVWMTESESSTKVFQDAITAILESDVDVDMPLAGETFDIGPLGLEILHPNQQLSGDLNQDSLSIRVTYGNISFLFTGDAYKEQELEMIQSAKQVAADILQLGHHGSNTSSDQQFIDVVDPDIAIYSAGTDNSYGHPSIETISLLEDKGMMVYGTDVHGTIIISTDGIQYNVKTKQDGTISPESKDSNPNEEKEETQKEANKANSSPDCVDINSASTREIQTIIHIGPVRAKDLVNGRPYETIDEMTRINGIGPARIKDIKEENNACIGGQ